MLVLFGRRVLAGALAIALTAIVALPPETGFAAAARTPSTPPAVALNLTAQKIWFKPALSGTVGDTTTLSAAVDSGLPVSFASGDQDRCKVAGTTLTFIKVGTCRVIASQAGDGITWGPAPNVIVAIEVSHGYHAKATATHAGVVRTDGAIQVGDVLSVSLTAAGTAVKACSFRITTAGGWMMKGDGAAHPDGSCTLKTVVPMPSDAVGRAALPGRDEQDLCVTVMSRAFADGKKRVMATSDRLTPGGFTCRGDPANPDDVLDFAFDGTGSPSKFSSSPNLLSWNIADWDPAYVPLQYNTDWHVSFPTWVKSCGGPYLNGDWTTVYRLENKDPGCPDWSLRLPGMLPRNMPWDGRPASWNVEMVMEYTNELGKKGQTITTQTVPYAPSDGEFRSSFPAISPTDVASARYVHVGERWQPTFRISGIAEATSCHLQLTNPGEGQVAEYSAAVDVATLVCAFDVPAFVKDGGVQPVLGLVYDEANQRPVLVWIGHHSPGTAHRTDDPRSSRQRERDDDHHRQPWYQPGNVDRDVGCVRHERDADDVEVRQAHAAFRRSPASKASTGYDVAGRRCAKPVHGGVLYVRSAEAK